MQTIQSVSQSTLKIEVFVASRKQGEFLSYAFIEKETGVKMDFKGRSYLRSSLRRLKLPYETIRGQGIKTLSSENASRIVVGKVVKIDNSIKRAEKTTKQVRDNVFYQLSEQEQKNINFLSALFGTIRSYSQSAKKIFKNETIKIGETIK